MRIIDLRRSWLWHSGSSEDHQTLQGVHACACDRAAAGSRYRQYFGSHQLLPIPSMVFYRTSTTWIWSSFLLCFLICPGQVTWSAPRFSTFSNTRLGFSFVLCESFRDGLFMDLLVSNKLYEYSKWNLRGFQYRSNMGGAWRGTMLWVPCYSILVDQF